VPALGTVVPALQQRDRGAGRARARPRRRPPLWCLALATVLLGVVFLTGTAAEWVRLITRDGLTIGTNLFGTTFYALVGLHASHVVVGLVMLALISVFAWSRALRPAHAERVELVSWY